MTNAIDQAPSDATQVADAGSYRGMATYREIQADAALRFWLVLYQSTSRERWALMDKWDEAKIMGLLDQVDAIDLMNAKRGDFTPAKGQPA